MIVPRLIRLAVGTFAVACLLLVGAVTAIHYQRTGDAGTRVSLAALRPAHAVMPTTPGSVVGVYVSGEPQSIRPLHRFETLTGTRLQEVVYYSGWQEQFKTAFASAVYQMGAVTMVQIEPRHVSLNSIVDGSQDGYLVSYADAVREFRRPVILCFGHEMNGDWYPWGFRHVAPSTFIAAWRHVVGIFRQQGADNATWLWAVNVQAGTHGHVSDPALWWPGNDVVAWIGLDGYFYKRDETFQSLFGPAIAAVRKLTGKPVLISETGADPQVGQAAKISGLFAGVKADGLLGLIWFDATGKRDWAIDSNPAALAAFGASARKYANDGEAP
jgi:hypothetical protein